MIRQHVVRGLVELFTDRGISPGTQAELFTSADATEEERLATMQVIADICIAAMVEAGALKVKTPQVLDLTARELRAYSAIYAVVSKWDISLRDDYRLEDAMKVIPVDHANLIIEAIRYGGWI